MEESIIKAKALLLELYNKDFLTYEHSLDVYVLVRSLYAVLPEKLRAGLDKDNLFLAALLHDVGKILIPDAILKKNTGLTSYEKEVMKNHARFGKNIIEGTGFSCIANWIYYHHEREDGQGYYGLTRDKIPFESKIIAVADTYSALTMKRVYHNGETEHDAVKVLRDVAGTQLNSTLVKLFCRMVEEHKILTINTLCIDKLLSGAELQNGEVTDD